MERAKGFEPSTPTLARLCSTPELHPHPWDGAAAPWALYAVKPPTLQQGAAFFFTRPSSNEKVAPGPAKSAPMVAKATPSRHFKDENAAGFRESRAKGGAFFTTPSE